MIATDGAAHHNAGALGKITQSRLQQRAADVVKVNIDAVGARRGKGGAEVAGRSIVYAGIVPAVPTVRAPKIFPIWPATVPTAPPAPLTSSVSPGCGLPISSKPK